MGDAGTTSFTWLLLNNTDIIAPDGVIKTGGEEWDAGAYSVEGYVEGAFMSFQSGETLQDVVGGLATTNLASPQPDGAQVDFGWHLTPEGDAYIVESGSAVAGPFVYTPETSFGVTYDSFHVTWLLNGTIQYQIERVPSFPFYLAIALGETGSTVRNVHFGPQGATAPAGTFIVTQFPTSGDTLVPLTGEEFVEITSSSDPTLVNLPPLSTYTFGQKKLHLVKMNSSITVNVAAAFGDTLNGVAGPGIGLTIPSGVKSASLYGYGSTWQSY